MNWTTEYPTKPGWYWIRNWAAIGVPEVTPGSEVVHVIEDYAGDPDLVFYFTGNPSGWERSELAQAEWQGPIEPEKERRNRSEFIRATPGMVCGDCGESDKRSFVSWKVGEADGKPMYGIICRDCWIKRLTPEQRKVYMV